MAIRKQVQNFGHPWETEYGYAQGVKVGDTIYLSGQVGSDGEGSNQGDMQAQMVQAYASIRRLLEMYGASMANIVEEVLYVTDVGAAGAAASEVRKQALAGNTELASTLVEVQALAAPDLMIEIRCTARV